MAGICYVNGWNLLCQWLEVGAILRYFQLCSMASDHRPWAGYPPHTLTTTDGQLSDGHYKVLVLGGTPSGANTITISPNDQEKLYFVQNNSGQQAIFTQGSGGNATVNNGDTAIIYADGAGAGAQVTDFTNTLAAPTDLVNDTTPQLGGDLDTNGNAILFGSSKWEIELDTGDDDLLFKYNGTTVFKLSSAGAVVSADNITAYGTP